MEARGAVAVVTGGGGGIGLELCRELLAGGAYGVCVVDNSLARLEAALGALGCPERVSAHAVDVTSLAEVERLRGEVLARWGRVSMLFNNAGVVAANNLLDSSWSELKLVVDVNLWGAIHCTKVLLPELAKEPRAAVVNTSSLEGLIAIPGNVAYCTSKYAIRGFSEALALDLGITHPHVLVSVVCPGLVATQMLHNNRERVRTDHLDAGGNVERLLGFKPTVQGIERGFRALASTTPEAAAQQVLAGVRAGRRRVLIGTDTVILDLVSRLLPNLFYNRLVYALSLSFSLLLARVVGKKTLALAAALLLLQRRAPWRAAES
jgi:NAD(P)-dependent dehydrogenase (short-subunit alcohol dehydrogenase family)